MIPENLSNKLINLLIKQTVALIPHQKIIEVATKRNMKNLVLLRDLTKRVQIAQFLIREIIKDQVIPKSKSFLDTKGHSIRGMIVTSPMIVLEHH